MEEHNKLFCIEKQLILSAWCSSTEDPDVTAVSDVRAHCKGQMRVVLQFVECGAWQGTVQMFVVQLVENLAELQDVVQVRVVQIRVV